MKVIIAAMDKDRGIGAANELLWQRTMPADLAHFKKLTTGKSVIMGRKTFESIGRPLPHRQNIVISRQGPIGVKGVISVFSIEAAYAMAQFDIAIIGGGEIYKQTIDNVDMLYITEVDATFPEATVFFPSIDLTIWQETRREHHKADENNQYNYDFVTYTRINSST